MTEQRSRQDDHDSGQDDQQEPKLDAEVIQDLDTASADAEAVRGGVCAPNTRITLDKTLCRAA
jgi:hypothetical protein